LTCFKKRIFDGSSDYYVLVK